MSIICQHCSYVMTQSELTGYMLGECYNIFKTVILPSLFAQTRTSTFQEKLENALIGILNNRKIECHVCHKYTGWSSKLIPTINDIRKYKFINKIKTLPFVQKVLLFGSRARGTEQQFSDIDLAIICNDITTQQWQQVLDIIENADTLLEIDCLQFNKVDDELKKRILKDGVEL